MLLLVSILVLLFAVPWAYFIGKVKSKLTGILLMAPALAAFIILVGPVGTSFLGGQAQNFQFDWVPQLDLTFSLNLHGPGLLLASLVTGIGSLIMLYASGYMSGYAQANRLYAYLYAFMLAMLGMALSDHLLLFFIFWELTSITSYLLIGFSHEKGESRRNALQALLVTGLGGMALMAGFILIAQASGTWLISDLLTGDYNLTAHAWYPAMLTLVLIGAFTKSAQFPFHFWLPNAMAAPTPVSAYLHSATMVKAGVFLMALMLPILGGTQAWTLTLCIAGGITLFLGGWFGLQQIDLKKLLAGTTLAVLGLLTFLLGIGTEKAAQAAVLFLLGHALYKATLFMTAGSIDHETGTRDTRILGSLRRLMPLTCIAGLLAAISKMGLPPMLGFIGKEYTYKATLAADSAWLVTSILILGNAILLALAVKAGILPFWTKGKPDELPKKPHEAPISMVFGPILLGILGVSFGLFPALLKPLVQACVDFMSPGAEAISIKLWAGFNLPLLMSAITVALGFAVLFANGVIQRVAASIKLLTADELYDKGLASVVSFANLQTRVLQSGMLRNYLLIILAATFGLVAYKLGNFGGFSLGDNIESFSWPAVFVTLLMFPAIGFAIFTQNRITALIALGVVGFGVALIFAIYSAPDLAITQILVETLTVALFAWVVFKLPVLRRFSQTGQLLSDALISILAGGLVTVLVLKSKSVDIGTRISDQLAAWSYPEAHGSNVVNVILVDFRALDTFGEIVVLFIAAVGVWALLTKSKKPVKGELS